jgi:hypothetical protein
MSEFVNNFFVASRSDRGINSPKNSNCLRSLESKDAKKATYLYMSKIIQ